MTVSDIAIPSTRTVSATSASRELAEYQRAFEYSVATSLDKIVHQNSAFIVKRFIEWSSGRVDDGCRSANDVQAFLSEKSFLRLAEFMSYATDGWYFGGGRAITKETCMLSKQFVRYLAGSIMESAFVFASPEGDLQFVWRVNEKRVSVRVNSEWAENRFVVRSCEKRVATNEVPEAASAAVSFINEQ